MRISEVWTLKGSHQRQRKNGTDTLGAIFGSTGGNPRGAILAVPVDYVTDNFVITTAWQSDTRSLQFSYRGSLFQNENADLRWRNPFDNGQWLNGSGYSDGAFGQMALSPDNQFHNVSLSGLYGFSDGSRLSGTVAMGCMQQDEVFLPYSSVFSAASPLPALSLQGDVRTLNASLNYATRLASRLSLRARYTADVRDNDTRRHLYQRIPGDSAAQAALVSSNTRLNRPYSHGKQQIALDSVLRLSVARQLQLSYQYDLKHREFVAVDSVNEQSLGLKFRFPLPGAGSTSVELQEAARRGSAYKSNEGFLNGHNPDFIATLSGNELFENDPLLRRFHLADRNRSRTSVMLNTIFPAGLSLNINGNLTRDEFPGSLIGLQSSDAWHLDVNLGYSPANRLNLNVYRGWQAYRNDQAGYERSNRTPFYPASERLQNNNWYMSSLDKVHSSGASINWTSMNDRWEIRSDVSISDAGTQSRPASPGLDFAALPDFKTRFATFNTAIKYTFTGGNGVSVRYRYDDYHSSDFALDNVAVDSLNNILLLGNASPVYSGSMLELRFTTMLP